MSQLWSHSLIIETLQTKSAYSIVNFFDTNERAMQKIMAEIYTNGPIEAGYNVYQDFLQYKVRSEFKILQQSRFCYLLRCTPCS